MSRTQIESCTIMTVLAGLRKDGHGCFEQQQQQQQQQQHHQQQQQRPQL
jgi:hypothetical protein